ncbi:hypothetical protein BKA62DRAFT_832240 [Auriculariales sp. MPI-PUGE-AT-0066]|nr:hypothetical protein BKA62DRAFT_832240 [Auriculariales sp. MPI-PUGE-AT-0066]
MCSSTMDDSCFGRPSARVSLPHIRDVFPSIFSGARRAGVTPGDLGHPIQSQHSHSRLLPTHEPFAFGKIPRTNVLGSADVSSSGSSAPSSPTLSSASSSSGTLWMISTPPPTLSLPPRENRRSYYRPPKKYFCTECPGRFARPSELAIHSTKHTGLRPYSCPLCKGRFTTASNLKRHGKRIHPEHQESLVAVPVPITVSHEMAKYYII